MIASDIIESLRDQARDALSSDLAESSLVNPSEDEEARAWSILFKLVESENRKQALKGGETLDDHQRAAVAHDLFNHFFRIGPLQEYLEEESVEEIVVNGQKRGFVIRDDGSKEQIHPGFTSDAEIRMLLTRVVSRAGRRIDESSPAVDVRLPDGSRLHAVLPPSPRAPA